MNETQQETGMGSAEGTDYPATSGVPLTLNASRPLTGVVTHASFNFRPADPTLSPVHVGVGAGLTIVEVTVTATERSPDGRRPVHTLGTATVSYTATPPEVEYPIPWSIELPAELDKVDLLDLTLTLVVRGYNALHGYTIPNDTHLTVPTYSASFDRRVLIAVDDDPFTTTGVSVSQDHSGWEATIPTPPTGPRNLKVRSVQGYQFSTMVTTRIQVTE